MWLWLKKLLEFEVGTDFYFMIGGLVCGAAIFVIIPGVKMIWDEYKEKQNRGEVWSPLFF